MKDEYAFMTGGPIVARGPQTFHVETLDPAATRTYFDNATNARRSQEEPWRPIGQIRREDLHRLLDEWLDKLGSA
jgi:hypothetical protein